MRPNSAVRLVFGAASAAVAKVARRQQPDPGAVVGSAIRHVAAGIERTSRRVRETHTLPVTLFLLVCAFAETGNSQNCQLQTWFKV
jgi:hypothetical protein